MKKITLAIGIPAFNEEQTIESLLCSVVKQSFKNMDLKKIIVISDNSTDKTNVLVKKVSKKFSVITLIESKKRKGKYAHVNELFHLSKTDVLVILDADIALSSVDFIEKLVLSLSSDKKAVMAAAHNELLRPSGFLPRIIHTHFVMWDIIRLQIPQYDSAINFYGSATAYHKSFYKSLVIPAKASDPHMYIYLAAKKHDGFRYVRDAVVLQNSITTVADVKKLLRRSIGKRDMVLEKIFGKEMIEKATHLPRKAKIEGAILCLVRYPLYMPLAVLFGFYLKFFINSEDTTHSPVWEIVTSTKKPIVYAKQ